MDASGTVLQYAYSPESLANVLALAKSLVKQKQGGRLCAERNTYKYGYFSYKSSISTEPTLIAQSDQLDPLEERFLTS